MDKSYLKGRTFDAIPELAKHQRHHTTSKAAQRAQALSSAFDKYRPLVTHMDNYKAEDVSPTLPMADNFMTDLSLKRDFENYLLKFGNNLSQASGQHLNPFENHKRHLNRPSITKEACHFTVNSPPMEKSTVEFLDDCRSLSPISLDGSPCGSPYANETVRDCLNSSYRLNSTALSKEYSRHNLCDTHRDSISTWLQCDGQPSIRQLVSENCTCQDSNNGSLLREKSLDNYCATILTPLTRPIIASEYPVNYDMLYYPVTRPFSNNISDFSGDRLATVDDFKEISQYFDFSDTAPPSIYGGRAFEPESNTRINVIQQSPPYSPPMNGVVGDVMVEDFQIPSNIPVSPPCIEDSIKIESREDKSGKTLVKGSCDRPSPRDSTHVIHHTPIRPRDADSKFDTRRIITSTDTNGSIAYICPDCGAQFRVRGYLVRHMRKHAKVMRFKCPLHALLPDDSKCHSSGGFSRGDTYKMHMKARHFIYPKCTPRKCRIQSTGTCGGCGQLFRNNDIWFRDHIKGKKCPRIWGIGPQKDKHNCSEKMHTPIRETRETISA